MALAQGSSELIWWPYIIAKYGLAFLCLLLPACLLQYPVNYAIGYYTMATGESIFQGFLRLNRYFAVGLWVMMAASFLWFGAFASAGGTSLAALTNFPPGWDERGQTLCWAYLSMAVLLAAMLASRRLYWFIERLMLVVALVTVVGLVLACSHPTVRQAVPAFLRGLVVPQHPLPRPWDPADATKLLTAITFAGLGGFWTLFYSYWLREKGSGMAARATSGTGCAPDNSRASLAALRSWRRFLVVDSGIGIFGNIATTLMTCLLAYALLHPQGLLPDKYELAVVQSRFFEASWGMAGRILFLLVAAAFLSDTWLTTADAVSRIHTDVLYHAFPAARRLSTRQWYHIWLAILTVITSVTMWHEEPGPLILLSAVIGFVGTVIFTGALLWLNYGWLPRRLPPGMAPGAWAGVALGVSWIAYVGLAVAYVSLRRAA
ncbi:MAG: Nramp family divalent metal transporter [Candidatus Omnitrophica bacterium]|nr:Nramp family divalent metal transporter [Candidatus Omnitrophota bacterium]